MTRPDTILFRTLSTGLVLILLLCGRPATTAGAEGPGPSFPPLFPVRLEHPFPQHRETFEEVRSLILEKYYSDRISVEALDWAAIEGMLRHISPPDNPELSAIWTPRAYGKAVDSLKGEQVALGFKSTFNPAEGSVTVTEVTPGSPADSKLRPYDRIMRINGRPLKGRPVAEIQALLAGETGESVTFTLVRDVRVFEITLQFKKFNRRHLAVTILNERIAMVEIRSFTTDLSERLKTELEKLRKKRISALLIDLRGNPGGVFIEALRVTEFFLPKGHILMRIQQRDTALRNYVSMNTDPYRFDVAILVNRKTASSAEILAACLQDHRKAMIVGTRTYGKGIVEKVFELKNGMHVKFVTAAMYSPKGVAWHARGVVPDFLVEQSEADLKTLFRMPPEKRLFKDVAIITACKLLKRIEP